MLDRRTVIRTAATTAGAMALGGLVPFTSDASGDSPLPRRPFRGKLGKLQLLQVGVGGTIAPADRDQLEKHADVAFTGLCDVDADALAAVAKDRPQAFTCRDVREAFDKHGGKFDAVVVCTPDHNHAFIDLLALKNGKHVYGQKPLVQQLSEVAAIEAAIAKRPDLVTQVGNQRMGPPGRGREIGRAHV